MSPELLCRYGYEIVQPVRFTLYLRVARPKRSVGVGRSPSDFHALRTSEERATHRQKLISIVQVEIIGQAVLPKEFPFSFEQTTQTTRRAVELQTLCCDRKIMPKFRNYFS